MLAGNFLELKLLRLVFEETESSSTVRLTVAEGDQSFEVEAKGVGVVDASWTALLDRYAREYQSLKTIQLSEFQSTADIGTKKAVAGVDAMVKVTLDVTNSEGRHFTWNDASRSVIWSAARVVISMVQYFVNAERAFVTLHNARRDALARGREDLVSRYTAEMAAVVESTSYAEVIENIRKELG